MSKSEELERDRKELKEEFKKQHYCGSYVEWLEEIVIWKNKAALDSEVWN